MVKIIEKKSVGIESFVKGNPEFVYIVSNDKTTDKTTIECPFLFKLGESDFECDTWNRFVKKSLELLNCGIMEFENLLDKAYEDFKNENGYNPYEKIYG